MKILIISLILTSSMAQAVTLESTANQEQLVIHDLEQIQNHGKKWHSKLKKATTVNKSNTSRQLQNEG